MKNIHRFHFLPLILGSILVVNSCTLLPQGLRKSPSAISIDALKKDDAPFKIQQQIDQSLSEADEYSEEVDTSQFPQEAYSRGLLNIVSLEDDADVKVELKSKIPNNMSGDVDGFHFDPLSFPIVIAKQDVVPKDANKVVRAQYNAWKSWSKDYFINAMSALKGLQDEELAVKKTEFEEELLHTLNKYSRKELRQTFQEAQQARKAAFIAQRKSLREAFKADRQALKSNIETYYQHSLPQKSGGFQTQSVSAAFSGAASQELLRYTPQFVSSLERGIGSFSIKQQNMLKKSLDNFSIVSPPPEPIAFSGNQADLTPRAVADMSSAVRKPSINVLTLNRDREQPYPASQKRNATEMKLMLQTIESKYPELKSVIVPFQAGDILKSLKDASGNALLNIDSGEVAKYAQCSGEAVSRFNNLPQDCDYAVLKRLDHIVSRKAPLELQQLIWGNNNIPIRSPSDSNILISYIFEDSNLDPALWLRHLLLKYYPNSATPANLNALSTFGGAFNQFYTHLSSTQEACQAPKTASNTLGRTLSMQTLQFAENLVLDGDYEFVLGFKNSTSGASSTLQKKRIPTLSEKLNISASQKYLQAQKTMEGFSYGQGPEAYVSATKSAFQQAPLLMYNLQDVSHEGVLLPYYPQKFWSTVKNERQYGIMAEISNKTGDLFDIDFRPIGETCQPLYKSDCVNNTNFVARVATNELDSGIYRLEARYHSARFADGQKVAGLNASFLTSSDLSIRHALDYLILNGTFSTFSQASQLPQYVDVISSSKFGANFLTGSSDTLQDLKFSNAQILTDLTNESSIFDRTLRALPMDPIAGSLDKPIQKSGQGRFIQEALTLLKQDGLSAVVKDNAENPTDFLIYNLIADLAAQNFQVFDTQFISTQASPYISVGAVVDFRHVNYAVNQRLRMPNNTPGAPVRVPLKLRIVSSTKGVVKSWKFNAYAGYATIAQRYWDGRKDINDSDADTPLSPLYESDEYSVQVTLDYDELNLDTYNEAIRKKYYNGLNIERVNLIQPLLSDDTKKHSTRATFHVVGKTVESAFNVSQIQDRCEALYSSKDVLLELISPLNRIPTANIFSREIVSAQNSANNTFNWLSQTGLPETCDVTTIDSFYDAMAQNQDYFYKGEKTQDSLVFPGSLFSEQNKLDFFNGFLAAGALKTHRISRQNVRPFGPLSTEGVNERSLNQVLAKVATNTEPLFSDATNTPAVALFTRLNTVFDAYQDYYASTLSKTVNTIPNAADRQQTEERLRGWLLELNAIIKDANGTITQPTGDFQTQFFFLPALVLTPQLTALLVGGAVVLAYSMQESLRHYQDWDAHAQTNQTFDIGPLIQQHRVSDLLINGMIQFAWNTYLFENAPRLEDQPTQTAYSTEPLQLVKSNGLPENLDYYSSPKGPHWDNYRERKFGPRVPGGPAGDILDLPNWEPYNGGHHIIQKGGTDNPARDRLKQCFEKQPPTKFIPPNYNKGKGIDAGSNIANLNPNFHGHMHTNESRRNMSRYIEDIFDGDKNVLSACNILSKDPCERIQLFLELVGEYLEKLSSEHADELAKLVLAYINEGGAPNINALKEALNTPDGQKFFKRQSGVNKGKLELNRLLRNKSVAKGGKINSSRLGLDKAQGKFVMDKRYKPLIEQGKLKLPEYVTRDLDMNVLCEIMVEAIKK